MSNPYVGEIRMFGGNFAPAGWAFCNGQLLPVSEHDALFSLIGTTYGGDGRTTFALPDLRGRVPVHQGAGPGLSPYRMGQAYGTEEVTLTTPQTPAHSHALGAHAGPGTTTAPAGAVPAGTSAGALYTAGGPSGGASMGAEAISPSPGSSRPHENVMPFQCVSFIISLFGIYPSQS